MRQGRRYGLSAGQKADIWRRWKAGESLHEIGRAFGKFDFAEIAWASCNGRNPCLISKIRGTIFCGDGKMGDARQYRHIATMEVWLFSGAFIAGLQPADIFAGVA